MKWLAIGLVLLVVAGGGYALLLAFGLLPLDSDQAQPDALSPVPRGEVVITPGGTVVVQVNPTATLYPTFTPVPATETPMPSPTPTPYVFQPLKAGELRPPVSLTVTNEGEDPVEEEVVVKAATPTAVPTVSPTGEPDADEEDVEVAEPTPLPTPYGQLDSGTDIPVRFLYQAVFPLQGRGLPERHLSGEVADLPPSAEFISTTAKYVGWVAAFDTLSVPDDWSFEGSVRWVNVNSLNRPFLMYESPLTLTKGTFILFRSMGHDVDSIWYPGWYRVAVVNSDLEEVIGWDFEVR